MNVDDLITKYKLVKSDKYIEDEDTYYVFNNHDYSITTGFVLRTFKNDFILATDVYFLEKQPTHHPNVSIAYGPWDIGNKIKNIEYHLKSLKRKYNRYLIKYKEKILNDKLMEISKDFQ